MRSKAARLSKPKKVRKKAVDRESIVSPGKIVSALVALIGLLAAVVTLLPRIVVSVSDPVDPNDLFSSSITVTNTGYIPLRSVSAGIGFGHIAAGKDNIPTPSWGPYTGMITSPSWTPHNLGLDDRFTFTPNDILLTSNLKTANITVIVDYEIPIIHLKREKLFPLFAKTMRNGKLYWYATN